MLFGCLQTHPLLGFLRVLKQEVSSFALASYDRKSKLPRTSSIPRVSSGEEHLNRERSFWGRAQASGELWWSKTPRVAPRVPSE